MTPPLPSPAAEPARRAPWYLHLYAQVLIGVVLGILVGILWPAKGAALKPLGDAFVNLVKMLVGPIIFCTLVHGIASMRDMKKLGRVGIKALIYFEIVSTVALILGLVVVNLLEPGAGFQASEPVDPNKGAEMAAKAKTTTEFLLEIIPKTFVSAFTSDNLLQTLLVAILTAFAIAGMGEHGQRVLDAIETGLKIFFGIMRMIVRLAPIGAFGAMAYTVGSHGLGSLANLAKLMGSFYLTALIFVAMVLGGIARASGFSLWRFLAYIKEELLLVLGTSSSETALPGMLRKMRKLGCAESTVGLVIPTGYSFNLDGTNIYMTMGAVFLAQATNTPLGVWDQITLVLVAMVSSKGAAGVTGAGLVALAATLNAVQTIPIWSLALIVGIDRFMSECRSITNLIGNGVATVAVSRWEGEVTPEELRRNMV